MSVRRKFEMFLAGQIFPYIRMWVYRAGFRPKSGSSLYSPSWDLIHQVRNVMISDAFANGIARANKK